MSGTKTTEHPREDQAPPRAPLRSRGEREYALGARISLEDFLALPAEGYDRDEEGRLVRMSPDNFKRHRSPMSTLLVHVARWVPKGWKVYPDAAIAFERIHALDGRLLDRSFLGPKAIQPDIACYEKEPPAIEGPSGSVFASPEGLKVVAEVLSPSTWRADLGIGQADEVNRWRTYLEAGVPEYWIVNVAVEEPGCPLPPGSALFLAHDPGSARFIALAPEGAKVVADVRGHSAYGSGRFRSPALPGFELDLDAFFRESAPA